jgi:DNA (cytosine-5)-methyltransferase 1
MSRPVSTAVFKYRHPDDVISTAIDRLRSACLDDELLAPFTHALQATTAAERRRLRQQVHAALRDLVPDRGPQASEWSVPFPPVDERRFTFVDLFAGIGGMRLAMQNAGGRCVFSSEWDGPARATYLANFGEYPYGDVTTIDEADVPEHDLLVAGFPCQAFSIAGFKGGFRDSRGTLFFDVARILDASRPRAFLLENVKGLVSHDRGRTLSTILRILRDDLGYHVPDPQTVNARYFGVPQNRERIFIVGFRNRRAAQRFAYPKPLGPHRTVGDILESQTVDAKYYLSKQYLSTLRRHRAHHESLGHGFGYEVIPHDGVANAIVVGGMGRERNLVVDERLDDFTPTTRIKGGINREGIRRMTPREWARLQGFPDSFRIVVADAQAFKQFGNSVAVPAIEATSRRILEALDG